MFDTRVRRQALATIPLVAALIVLAAGAAPAGHPGLPSPSRAQAAAALWIVSPLQGADIVCGTVETVVKLTGRVHAGSFMASLGGHDVTADFFHAKAPREVAQLQERDLLPGQNVLVVKAWF
ncbi:MAG: hypothetical protein ACR2KG_05665 [Nocardioidaceae bacterium]